MAFCRYCGKTVDTDVRFCTGCGKPTGLGAHEEMLLQTPTNVRRKSGWLVFSLILLCTVFMLVGLYVYELFYYRDRISLDPFIHVTYSGTEGNGRVVVAFDQEEFVKTLTKEYEHREIFRSILEKIHTEKAPDAQGIRYLAKSFALSFNKMDGLSEGDSLSLNLSYATSLASRFAYSFTWKEKGYQVKGLTDRNTKDPFTDIEVQFVKKGSEILPLYQNHSKDDLISEFQFTFDVTKGLAIGDLVTLRVTKKDMDKADLAGVILTPLEKRYTVGNVASYLMKGDKLTDSVMKELYTTTASRMEAFFTTLHKVYEVTGKNYVGYSFFLRKEGTESDHYNGVALIYEVSLKSLRTEEVKKYYLVYSFFDLITDNKGILTYAKGPLQTGAEITISKDLSFFGYEDKKALISGLPGKLGADFSYSFYWKK